jgi:simple sugar transport system permease protein
MKTFAQRPEASVTICVLLLVAFFAIGTNGVWFNSLPSVLRLTAQLGIIAIGQAILMTSGEIDLSVGSTFAIAGVVFINAMEFMGVAPAMAVALAFSCFVGLLNALISVRFRVPSMIVTLGAMFVYRGIAYLATTGSSISIPHDLRADGLVLLFKTRFLGLNASVLLLVILTAILAFILAKTRFGSHLQAVGGNAASALANGVSPAWIKTKAFVLCSFLAGVAGVMVVAQEGSVYGTSGMKMELETIAAAIIGGCSMRGGSSSIWGPVLGVFMLSSLKGGLLLMGAPTSWYIAFVGAILIGFLILSSQFRKVMGAVV